jgi:hypothetical protein
VADSSSHDNKDWRFAAIRVAQNRFGYDLARAAQFIDELIE